MSKMDEKRNIMFELSNLKQSYSEFFEDHEIFIIPKNAKVIDLLKKMKR